MSVWGIDPGAVSPAIAEWPSKRLWSIPTEGKGPSRLAGIAREVHSFAVPFYSDELEAIFIENPIGRFTNAELYRATGVIEASILNALRDHFPHEPTIFRLTPGEWRKAIGLPGNCNKLAVLQWADAHADTESQDEADALAIACAGHTMLATEQQAA